MKTMPAGMQSDLNTGMTTLCTCWRLQRLDGQVFGFTNHDRDLVFNGTTFVAATGFTPAETASGLGLQVDTAEIEGALSSGSITEADIALGLWDNASAEIWRVDWSDVTKRVITRKGSLGEISRGAQAFGAEIRGLAHMLNQTKGRTYSRICDETVGTARCGINTNLPIYKGTGAITAVTDRRILTVSGLAGFAEGWFQAGLLNFTSGAAAGAKIEVGGHRFIETGGVLLELWRQAERPLVIGDTFTVTVGCGRTWKICQTKFANSDNFRGFPHMPGSDAAYQLAKKSGVNDGGSFFK